MKHKSKPVIPISVVALCFVVIFLAISPAHANTTIIVTTTDDELNSDGDCSLREAIRAANLDMVTDACSAGSGTDTIILPVGTYTLTIAGSGEDLGSKGDLDITSNLIIVGASAAGTIIDGNRSVLLDRVVHINYGASAEIAGVTIRNGDAGNSGGGGVYSTFNSSLVLTNSTVSGNRAQGGGGVESYGVLTITNSTVSNNQADVGGGGGVRGFGLVTIINSTISGNSTNYAGGGLYYHNTAIPSGSVAIFNSTITLNTASVEGGGILNVLNIGTISVRNSLIAGNVTSSGQAPECAGTISSQGYNLLKNSTGCDFSATTGDQVGTGVSPIDPVLSTLQDNGGTTFTHALSPSSPAIDAGDPTGCRDNTGSLLATDQRGYNRTTDGDLDGIANCDIGAYELPTLSNRTYIPVILR